MGAVYRARQPELDRLVALKILPPELCAEEQYLERFRTEARAMAQLNHPNVVGVYDFGEASGYFEVDGGDAEGSAALLAAHGGFGPEFALPVLEHVCEGIAYAHGKGVVHLDLKPGNIMLNNDGMVKILDFGLAKLLDPATGSAHEDMGTPDYAAPERFQEGSAIDHRADIYSMGVILYEMLVGKVPREGSGMTTTKLGPGVNQSLDAIIQRCTRTDATLRYQTAAEIKGDLVKVEKKVQQQLLKSPGAAMLLTNSASPQVAAAAKKIRRKMRRGVALRKLRTVVLLAVILAALAVGAWKMNLVPESLLTRLGVPVPPAKPTEDDEVPPMFPELAKHYATLGEELQSKVDAPRAEAIGALGERYEAALSKLEANANSGLVQLIAAERARYARDGGAPANLSSIAELAKRQQVLVTEMGKIEAAATKGRNEILKQYDQALARLLAKVEKEGRAEDAERVKQERERIRSL